MTSKIDRKLLMIEALQVGVRDSISLLSKKKLNKGEKETLDDLKKLLAYTLMMRGELIADEMKSTQQPN